MAQLSQDGLERLRVSIRFALVRLRLLGFAQLDTARVGRGSNVRRQRKRTMPYGAGISAAIV